MRVCQFAERGGKIGRHSFWAGLKPHGFLKSGNGFVVLPAIIQNATKCQCGSADHRMVGRKMAFAHVETLAGESFRFFELGLVIAKIREGDQAFGYFGAIRSIGRLALCERCFQERISWLVFAELIVHSAESLIEVSLNLRLFIEGACLLFAAFENGDDPEIVSGASGFSVALKQVLHELLDALGTSGLCKSRVASFRKAQSIKDYQADYEREDERRSGDTRPIASDKFAHSVESGIRPSLQRLAAKIVIDVTNQRFHRTVSALGILMHRRETEDIEVSPSRFAD